MRQASSDTTLTEALARLAVQTPSQERALASARQAVLDMSLTKRLQPTFAAKIGVWSTVIAQHAQFSAPYCVALALTPTPQGWMR